MSERLLGEVRNLIGRAQEAAAPDTPTRESLDAIALRLDEPLRVAFAGKLKAGKSTLLNALVGEEIAPTDAGECTKIVTWYRNGHTYSATLHLRDGTVAQTSFTRDSGAIEIDLKGLDADAIEWIEVTWPSSALANITLIDTPGLGSANVEVSERTHRFMSVTAEDGDEPTEADAVIYLMRHLHRDDLGFLEAFLDSAYGRADPINTVAILSRADEVGACRREAMTSARFIAQNYRSDPRLRRLCQTVVPVAGLVAQSAATLTEREFQSLRTLSEVPPDQLEELLVTVDRFTSEAPLDVTPIERRELLERLGLYGVRVAVSLCRLGAADNARSLADELRTISGIEDLSNLLQTMFAQRRDVLKARAALAALEEILRNDSVPGAETLLSDLERVTASAHEFNEVQLLNAVRSGALELTPEETAEVERLLGTSTTVAQRLGVAGGGEREAALEAATRWQRRAENPMSSKAVADAARVVVRSYEGLLAEFD